METNIAVCTEETPIETVYAEMMKSHGTCAAVIENRAHRIPIGMVTEHLICEQIIGRRRNPRGMTAANVMSSNIIKVYDTSDITSCPADTGGAGNILVVNDAGELCGVLPADLLRRIGIVRSTQELINAEAYMPSDVNTANWLQ